ncbi:TPA: autotransporter outer membrane beta-barrel domain-containing protein, partial [Escherichia coli]|nr:autotransporter outer membrane beta-barrel domain-containing protein [Escherichia coli]
MINYNTLKPKHWLIMALLINNTSMANNGDFTPLNCASSQCFLRGSDDFIIDEHLSLNADKLFVISTDKLDVTGELKVDNGTVIFAETRYPYDQINYFKYNIKNGGKVSISGHPGDTAKFGFGVGWARGGFHSDVEFNVEGEGSKVTYNNQGYLFAGGKQSGATINISAGGVFDILNKSPFYLGLEDSTIRPTIMNITGKNSELNSEGDVWLGVYSPAGLLVTDGGHLSASSLLAGWHAPAYVLLSGHDSGLNTNYVYLAYGTGGNEKGDGLLQLQNQAHLTTKTIFLGKDSLGNAALIIGSNQQGSPTAAGVLNANKVLFGTPNSSLVLNHTSGDYEISASLAGNGKIYAVNGESFLTGENHLFNGDIDIDSGAQLHLSPVNISSVNNKGTLTFSGTSSVSSLTNSGTIDLRGDAPGNVLTVGGNYTSNNGTLLMNTVLGDDSSATDKLVIKGDASGQ